MSAVVIDVEDGQYTVCPLELNTGNVVRFGDVKHHLAISVQFPADPDD